MPIPENGERAQEVQQMFSNIAPRYDLMNRIMTFGQDQRWRKDVILRAKLPPGGWLLDLGAGTGDLAQTALKHDPTIRTVAADFTLTMMRIGKKRLPDGSESRVDWMGADATMIPFRANSFDAVISGFLLRNVADLERCIAEQYRVLKPGGVCVALDTTPPPSNLLRPLLEIHLHAVIPTLGRLITGQAEAYHYLPETTERFLRPEQLAGRFNDAGFKSIGYETRMFGTIAIHWGYKPGNKKVTL